MHRGPLGTAALNLELQRVLNPRARGSTRDTTRASASSLAGKGEGEGEVGDELHHDDAGDSDASGAALTPGDRVMQHRNNYDHGVVNGSIGKALAELPSIRLLTVRCTHRNSPLLWYFRWSCIPRLGHLRDGHPHPRAVRGTRWLF